MLAAAISRFASLLDGVSLGWLDEPEFAAIVAGDLATGVHGNPTQREGWFTTAYFHMPDELAAEVREVGLVVDAVLAVEGPGYWALRRTSGRAGHLDDDDVRQAIEAVRAVETEASLLGASPHLLVAARRPSVREDDAGPRR